jgi:iron complex outermembrane recepter protein
MTISESAALPRAKFVAGGQKASRPVKSIVHRKGYLAAALLMLSWIAAGVSWAGKAEQQFDFNIPRLPMDKALARFFGLTGVMSQYDPGQLPASFSNAVKGRYTAREALRIMLARKRVQHEFIGDGDAVIITVPRGQPSMQPQRRPSDLSTEPPVLIRGSRSSNRDLTRSNDDIAGSGVLTAPQIEASSYSTLDDILRNDLTLHSKASIMTGSGLVFRPFDKLNVLGLGSHCTVVTVNGRRSAGVSANGIVQQPELALYPAWNVERVEVVPGPASAFRGPGGVCGLVNVVLKEDEKDTVVHADWGHVGGTRADFGTISGKTAFDIEKLNGSVFLVGGVGYQDGIRAHEQNTLTPGREAAVRNNAALAAQSVEPPLGGGKNVKSANNTPLLKNGTCSFLNIPADWDGAMEKLIGCEYDYSLANSAQDWGGANAMLVPSTRNSYLNATGVFDLQPALTLRLDGGYLRALRSGEINVGDSTVGRTYSVPSTHPGNRFGQDVIVTEANPLGDGLMISKLSTWNVLGALTWRVGDDSAMSMEHGRSKASIRTTQPFLRFDPGAAVESSGGFLERPAMPYVLDSAKSPVAVTRAYETSLLYRTKLFPIAEGSPDLTVIGSHRKEDLEDADWLLSWSGNSAGAADASIPGRSQSTYSLQTQLRTPILAPREGASKPLLSTELSLRGDRYSVSMPSSGEESRDFESLTGEISLGWRPSDWLLLRGTYSTGEQPPALALLADPIEQAVPGLPIIDPVTGRQPGPLTIVMGGSRDLQPQRAQAWRGGFVLTFKEDVFRFSSDWIRVRLSDLVLTSDDLLFRDPRDYLLSFADRVERATNADGTPGDILRIDTSALNIARQEVHALQLSSNWRLNLDSLGKLELSATATNLPDFLMQSAPDAARRGLAGNRVPPEWRALFRAVFSFEGWELGWTGRHTSATRVSDDGAVIASQGNGGEVGDQFYQDVFVKYSTEWRGVDFTFRADGHNILNARGPFDASEAYYFSRYFESERRSVRASITARF